MATELPCSILMLETVCSTVYARVYRAFNDNLCDVVCVDAAARSSEARLQCLAAHIQGP